MPTGGHQPSELEQPPRTRLACTDSPSLRTAQNVRPEVRSRRRPTPRHIGTSASSENRTNATVGELPCVTGRDIRVHPYRAA
jgi:hypothetical protein